MRVPVFLLHASALGHAASAATSTYVGPAGSIARADNGQLGIWRPTGSAGHCRRSGTSTELVFGGTSAAAYTATNDLGNPFSLNVLRLESTNAGATETLAGTGLSFGGTSAAITQNGTGAFFISTPIALSGATAFNGSGSGLVNLNGALSGSGSLTLANTNRRRDPSTDGRQQLSMALRSRSMPATRCGWAMGRTRAAAR